MPFTVAHTVAAPPLWRATGERLLLSAVVVGSLAPDLEYLVHLDTRRTIGHLWWGALVLDLPVALILLVLWHRVVKRPLAALSGPSGRGLARVLPPLDLRPFPFRPGGRFLLVALSVLAGIGTHLLWDGFTHRDGFLTTRIGVLTESIGRPHVYDLFNYASTAVGLVVLGWWWRRAAGRPAREPVPTVPARARHVAVTLVVVGTAGGGVANALRLRLDGWGLETTVAGAVLGAMAAGGVVVLCVSAVLHRALSEPW